MELRLPAPQALLEMIAAGLGLLALLVGGLLLMGQVAAASRPGDGAARLPGIVLGLLLAFGTAGALLASGAMISAGATEAIGRMPQMLGWK
ncbi:hypothetical protein [Falsiroseomonas sp. HW251]|uniref:hypothetical protein n=1 Tax=Falsiroseomonas sp. HW251 TaxID=3390998 RepID=UPI003D318F91